MDSETRGAREALHTIARAQALAARNSQNNGTVPLVWGAAVLVGLVSFDIGPRLAPGSGLGFLLPAIVMTVLPLGTALWTTWYRRRLPVQPRAVDRPRLFLLWGFYHGAVLFCGMGLGLWLAARQHLACLPPFTMTLTGLADAAPLLWVGWQQRQRARGDAR